MAKMATLTTFVKSFFRFMAIAVIALAVWLCLRELAGRQTFADIRFAVLSDLKANRGFGLTTSWLLTLCTGAWGYGERRLRKQHIERTSSEGSKLQRMLDNNRRSSRLTKKGETGPEDVI